MNIESGYISPDLLSSELAYPINIADSQLEIPGSSTRTIYPDGFPVASVDLQNLTITLDVNLSDRILFSGNLITLRKHKIRTDFFYSYARIDNTLLTPRTIIFLDVTRASKEQLYDYIGEDGLPSVEDTFAIIGNYIQSPNEHAIMVGNYLVTKTLNSDTSYDVNIQVTIDNEVNNVFFRWREKPRISRFTKIEYDVISSGYYDSLISLAVSSEYGTYAEINPVCCVSKVEVLSGGEYNGTPTVTAISDYGHDATFVAVMSGTTIDHIDIISGGVGYVIPPSIEISGDEVTAATVKPYIGVCDVNIVNDGNDYIEAPTVTVMGNGSGAEISTAVKVYTRGSLLCAYVKERGQGYSTGDQVIFSGNATKDAQGYVVAKDGEIQYVIVYNAGYDYYDTPTYTIESTGSGGVLEPVTSHLVEWKYINELTNTFVITNLNKNVEYEWQMFTSTSDKNNQTFNTPVVSLTFD